MKSKLSDSPKAMTGQGAESARKALERQSKTKPKHSEPPTERASATPAPPMPKQDRR
jgi:hypothetical protein